MARDLKSLIDGIRNRDASVCGEAPIWVLEKVLERLEEADFRIQSGADRHEVIEEFYLGAVHFIADQALNDSELLLERIAELRGS